MGRYKPSLLLKNVAYGLTLRTLNFPSFFADAGYTVAWIECKMLVTSTELTFDFAAISPSRNVSAIIEIKGGTYQDALQKTRFENQLSKYSKISTQDVLSRGFPVDPPNAPASHSHQVFVMAPAYMVPDIEAILDSTGYSLPILCVYLEQTGHSSTPLFKGMVAQGADVSDSVLAAVLKDLDTGYPIPLSFLPFDNDSDPYDIVTTISSDLLTFLLNHRNGSRFHVDMLLVPVIQAWNSLTEDEKNSYRSKLHHLLSNHVNACALHKVLSYDSSARVWKYDPSRLGPLKKIKWQSTLTEMVDEFLSRFTKPLVQMPLRSEEDVQSA
jgi:hypothetical protein